MDTDPMIESKHRWEKVETRISRIDANGAHAGSETGAPAFAKGPCGRPPGAAGQARARMAPKREFIRPNPTKSECSIFSPQMDTDPMIESKHGRGKDFDANCTNFREGGTRRVGDRRSEVRQLAGWKPALRQVRENLSDWIRLNPSVQFFAWLGVGSIAKTAEAD